MRNNSTRNNMNYSSNHNDLDDDKVNLEKTPKKKSTVRLSYIQVLKHFL